MKYTIGLDFGTQSARGILVDVEAGNIVAKAIKEYTHGVMDQYLPGGEIRLPIDFALQHPMDYLEAIEEIVPQIIEQSGVLPENIIGISTDFTACTILPIDKEGVPLCFNEEFKNEPHAYVKLWKHHAAEEEANKVTQLAIDRNEDFLMRYGGKISSEWLVPKVLEILNKAPEVYEKADSFIEAADWINLILTGNLKRSSCYAGYKGIWGKFSGYPSQEYFKALDPRLENFVEDKLKGEICNLGNKAGKLTPLWSKKTGLIEGTAVGVSIIDAHSGVLGIGIKEPGKMLMIMGTSTCHILLSEKENKIPGISGVVEDGVLPGYYAYEAGQACVGDHFAWVVENLVPKSYISESKKRNIGIHQLLTEKANKLSPGESGLLALDWWNGNRTPYVDYDLTGLILGLNLSTKVEEIYRTLIEATAFGTKYIIETFENSGIQINELYACGGIAEKNKMLMQIYSDVTNKQIYVSDSKQTPALGAAIFAAVAAGKESGGYDSIFEAIDAMASNVKETYRPIQKNVEIYKRLYKEYKKESEYYAKDNNVMKNLKSIRYEVSKNKV